MPKEIDKPPVPLAMEKRIHFDEGWDSSPIYVQPTGFHPPQHRAFYVSSGLDGKTKAVVIGVCLLAIAVSLFVVFLAFRARNRAPPLQALQCGPGTTRCGRRSFSVRKPAQLLRRPSWKELRTCLGRVDSLPTDSVMDLVRVVVENASFLVPEQGVAPFRFMVVSATSDPKPKNVTGGLVDIDVALATKGNLRTGSDACIVALVCLDKASWKTVRPDRRRATETMRVLQEGEVLYVSYPQARSVEAQCKNPLLHSSSQAALGKVRTGPDFSSITQGPSTIAETDFHPRSTKLIRTSQDSGDEMSTFIGCDVVKTRACLMVWMKPIGECLAANP